MNAADKKVFTKTSRDALFSGSDFQQEPPILRLRFSADLTIAKALTRYECSLNSKGAQTLLLGSVDPASSS